MQNTTADYKLEINKPSRSFECKVTIGDNIYKNEDIVDIILDYTQPQDGFSIGNTVSQTLDLTLINKGDTIYSTSQIKLEIGLKIGSTIEYIPMGIFNIDDVEKTDYTTKFTCYDNMIKFESAYFSSLGDKPTLQQVVNELASKTGVQFTGSLPSYTVSKLDGFSCREILSYVASICAGNAVITRDGKFTIKGLSEVNRAIDGNNYITYTKEEIKYKIGQISCQVNENNILSKGSLGSDSMELQFENPWINETILTDIYNKLNGLSYLGYSMKWQGDLSLDPYDVIIVTDKKGVVRKEPILSNKFTYTGGLTSEIGAKGETKNKNSFSSSGSTSNKVNRLVTEQAVIKEALIEKANISDLKATNAEIANLKAKDAEIENAIINKANITDLNAINANIQNLIAEDARITNLIATKADITDLTATNIKFNVGTGGTLDLQTLLSKFVTGENGQFLNITSSNVVIANATIKDAMIENLSLNKLKAGTISTNKFTVASDDGGITIVGPTMQFKDKSNKVRIQMGQDTQGNFNFILRGADGTTTLIDHTGIKEKAIADNLIKSNMVAENAVGEKQINYSSLVTGLNKDTNTSLIKASKVAIDLTGQSLEVSFNSLKSNVDGLEIGGRNLAQKTNQGVTGWKWGMQTGVATVTEVVENGIKCCKFTRDSVAQTGWSYISYGYIGREKYLPSRKYTISFEVKASVDTTFFLQLMEGNSSNKMTDTVKTNNTIANTWTKVSATLTTISKLPSSTFQVLYISGMNSGVGVSYTFRNVKIEEGTKATDWTPAPEDIDKKIEANTTAISVTQKGLDALVKDTTIVKGDVTTLKDKYTSIKATVDGINTTVASHTTSISNLGTNVSKAQNTANSANSLADSKAKVFTSTPTTPYKVGDLWVQGTSGDVMRCKVARASGSYTASDWEKASKYTDDTKANAVEKNLSTLGGKVTTVETKQASLEQNLNGFKTTVSNTYSTKTELSGVDGKVSSLTSRVSTAEGSITQLNNKIALKVESTEVNSIVNNAVNGIQIGGRNLVINSHTLNNTYASAGGFVGVRTIVDDAEALCKKQIQVKCTTATASGGPYFIIYPKATNKIGKTYTWSFWAKCSTNKTLSSVGHECGGRKSISLTTSWQKYSLTWKFTDHSNSAFTFYGSYAVNDILYIRDLKIEEGTKATNWTPAPEDVDSAISTVDTKITTTNNKVASIETNLSSITQRVSSTESTVSSINGNVSNLTSRVNTAESKLTATSLTTTISTAINNGTNSITTTQFVMDKNGLTIKNGAIKIQNKAGTNVFASDTNGNLTITGTFINKNSNGVKAIEINNTNIYFYDWERNGRELGIIYSSYLTDYPNVRGFSLAHNQQGYMTLGYRKETNTFGRYMTFDKYAKNPTYAAPIRVHEGTVFHQAVNMQDRVYIPSQLVFDKQLSSTSPRIFKNTADSRNMLCTQVSVNAANDGYMIQTNTGGVLFSILAGRNYPILLNNNTQVGGNFTVTGSKNSLQATKSYGERLINAYETAEYYFGDIGSGVIKDGECIVWIDDIFKECINTDIEYHVFTQVYNGNITKIERHKDYFIVYGENETEFSWELKAKRLGYENVRLDTPEIGTVEDIPVFTEEDLEVKTVEDTLLNVLTFRLEDILMEG